jgi:hypothetical protein
MQASQRSLWDRVKRRTAPKQAPAATVQSPEPRRVSLSSLPDAEQLLQVEGEPWRYLLLGGKQDVMECGAEYTYLLLTYQDPDLRERGKRVISVSRVIYVAEAIP